MSTLEMDKTGCLSLGSSGGPSLQGLYLFSLAFVCWPECMLSLFSLQR